MEDSDKARFSEVMVRMSEVFQRDLTPLLIDEYFKALQKYPLRQVVWAGEQCIVDCLFFPKPAEIIKAMFSGTSALQEYHGPRQLQEPRDPEVAAKYLADIQVLKAKLGEKLPRMPAVSRDSQGKNPAPTPYRMSESNWRAKWDMAKIHPDLSILRENIPERLRIQFAVEDQEERETRPESPRATLQDDQ